MATSRKSRKKAAAKSATSSRKKLSPKFGSSWLGRLKAWFTGAYRKLKLRRQSFLKRRPHRSFRLTRRRDYRRSLAIPGYWAMTSQVFRLIWSRKRVFLSLVLVYGGLMVVLSSIMTEDGYLQIKDTVDGYSEAGLVSNLAASMTVLGLVVSEFMSGPQAAVGSSQQIIGILIGLFAWLTVIWLVRSINAGHKPKLRDGIYNSGSPVLALLVLALVLVLQAVPVAAAVILYGAANVSGIFDHTAWLMLAGGAAIGLSTLSAYWMISTMLAMVIVTLPGIYPMEAIRLAGDLVVGRRVRLLLRLAWLLLIVALLWVLVLLPTIWLDGAIKAAVPGLSWLPLVPMVAILILASSIVVSGTFIYLLYRGLVDDQSAPA